LEKIMHAQHLPDNLPPAQQPLLTDQEYAALFETRPEPAREPECEWPERYQMLGELLMSGVDIDDAIWLVYEAIPREYLKRGEEERTMNIFRRLKQRRDFLAMR
jgi:hypothetical protein